MALRAIGAGFGRTGTASENWFQSTQKTIFSTSLQMLYAGTKWGRMIKATIDDRLGCDINDKEAVIAAFHAHNARVSDALGPERLLRFEARDG